MAFGTELVAGSLGKGFVADPSASAEDNEKARKAFEQNRAALVGALAGYVTSGGNAVNVSQGSSIARGAVTWNRQLHIKEAELIERYAADFAVEQGYCESTDTCSDEKIKQAKTELTGEALRGVSDDFAHLETNNAAREFLVGLAASAGPLGPQVGLNDQHMFGVLDRNSEEYLNSVVNIGTLASHRDLYAGIDVGRGRDAVYSTYLAALTQNADFSNDTRKDVLDLLAGSTALSAEYEALARAMTRDKAGYIDPENGLYDGRDVEFAAGEFDNKATTLTEYQGFALVRGADHFTMLELLGGGDAADLQNVHRAFTTNLAGFAGGLDGALGMAMTRATALRGLRGGNDPLSSSSGNFTPKHVADFGDAFDARLPLRQTGQPTNGVIDADGVAIYLKSGAQGPANRWYDSTKPAVNQTATHVEGHAAALMVDNGITNMTVTINNRLGPCGVCRNQIPDLLPQGSTLNVRWMDRNGVIQTTPIYGRAPAGQ